MNAKFCFILLGLFILGGSNVLAGEFHVSVTGSDDASGSAGDPFLTISEAVRVARAGDTITVHKGIYREWVNPLYGGTSHLNRVLYRAAEGENVVIKGSEVVKEWKKLRNGVWKLTLDNAVFGEYNPYREIIEGDWFRDFGRDHHTGEVYLNGKSFYEIDSLEKVIYPVPLKGAQDQEGSLYQWYCESDSKTTTIWANFHSSDPNRELVEINVRPAVFFPKSTGIDYITVSGFTLSQAATTWAPPTSEQTGLIGPNWSKGWIIENNTISYSKCTGISLGKDRSTGQNYSSVYKIKSGHISQMEVVFRAIRNGWSKENVGSHIVRNNIISDCEQTGICGDMGAIISQIHGNHIYDIYVKRQWGGFEMGGIKLHAPIDVTLQNNCIHNTFKGMWIDWQAQGIRISGNLMYDNSWMDLHLEVSHGPHVIDNNLFLSDLNLWDMGVGSAFVNNLFAGQICNAGADYRFTPYHFPHSTKVAGMMTLLSGDERFLNNIYLNGAVPYKNGVNDVVSRKADPDIRIEEKADGIYLFLTLGDYNSNVESKMINSSDLGEAMVPGVIFDNPDGTSILFNQDYFNKSREDGLNSVGPFRDLSTGEQSIKVWNK